MFGPIRQNFAEVANLVNHHQKLKDALHEVFAELVRRCADTTGTDWNTAAAVVFTEKGLEWDAAAKDWADSQGNLLRAVGMHNEDLQATDLGPASNVLRSVAT
jgi:hypothetical protein